MVRKGLRVLGLFLLLYPMISNGIAEKLQKNVILSYQNETNNLEEDQVKKMVEDAQIYNQMLYDNNKDVIKAGDYQALLNPMKNGVMGYIKIPKIGINLPIYHGTEEPELEKGIGHIEGSSLPIGGMNTHSLLAGHRGTPEAELFVGLGELEEGDSFTVEICGAKSVYRICAIHTIKPDNIGALGIQQGRDLVSLITCTPYGINTHRLVVTGERKEAI